MLKIRSGILVLLICFTLATIPTALCASSHTGDQNHNQIKVITYSDNGKMILLQKGHTFALKLNENPSTGYSWQLHLSKGLKLIGDKYVPAPSGALGAAGTHLWTIKAVNYGSQYVKAVYKQPWEKTTSQDQTFKLKVKVKR